MPTMRHPGCERNSMRQTGGLSRAIHSLLVCGLLALVCGCEPANLDTTQDVSDTGTPSCCEEPTPSLADARKQAMMKDAAVKKDSTVKSDEPTAPSLLDTKKSA